MPYILFERYSNIFALELASPGNRHCGNCIGALSLWRARDAGVGDAPSTQRFAGAGVDFRGKLIGVEDVAEARGDKPCQVAMAKLKAGVKAAREHKQRIVVNVSLDGVRIIDDKSAVSTASPHRSTI